MDKGILTFLAVLGAFILSAAGVRTVRMVDFGARERIEDVQGDSSDSPRYDADADPTPDSDGILIADEGDYHFELLEDGSGYRVSAAEGAKLPEAVIPESFNGLPVVSVGGFGSHPELERLVLPSSLLEIEDYAFSGCSGLEAAVIPDGVRSLGEHCFSFCSGLETVSVPGSVERIGREAFWGCKALEEVVLEEGIREIGLRVFGRCAALGSVRFPDSVVSMETPFQYVPFLQKITLPAGIARYDSRQGRILGEGCSLLACLELPDTAASFDGYGMASSGVRIREMVIPAGIEKLLGLVQLGVERIFFKGTEEHWEQVLRNDTFVSWDGIRLTLGSIPVFFYSEEQPEESGRFWHYDELGDPAYWTAGEALLSFRLSDDGAGYAVSALPGHTLGDLVIPDSYLGLPVTGIDCEAFSGRTDLRSVVIPDTVIYIGRGAFRGCTGLTEAVLPDSVLLLGRDTFEGCTALSSLRLSENLQRFEMTAVAGCSALRVLEIPDSVGIIGNPEVVALLTLDMLVIPSELNCLALLEACTSEKLMIRGDASWYHNSFEKWNKRYARVDADALQVYFYFDRQPWMRGKYWHDTDSGPELWEERR